MAGFIMLKISSKFLEGVVPHLTIAVKNFVSRQGNRCIPCLLNAVFAKLVPD